MLLPDPKLVMTPQLQQAIKLLQLSRLELLETIRQVHRISRRIARALEINGPFNIQFIAKNNEVKVIECNLRASRSFPFVSKATGRPLAKIAARCMAGRSLKDQGIDGEIIPKQYYVKEAVFPFNMFPEVDPVLGPEMRSTGEVMGIDDDLGIRQLVDASGYPVQFATLDQ